jgi:transcriptional regulator with XRE-family HTH domain
MDDAKAIGQRILQVRRDADLTQEAFAKRLSVTRGAVGNWELGKGVKRENLIAVSNEFGSSVDWLATGATKANPSQVLKVGNVGAGQVIVPFEADEDEWVDAPPEMAPGTVAVEVRGESMLPAYEDGFLLYYSKMLPPKEMINKRCVVQLGNGAMLVKTLRRGTTPGYWNLSSLNAYDMEDQVVEWAAPIDWIKPR